MIGLPGETREDLLATIRLMAEAQTGCCRWTIFYPFPDTDVHPLAARLGYIDRADISGMQNFPDRSGLHFGKDCATARQSATA